jgi:hypothetical protein
MAYLPFSSDSSEQSISLLFTKVIGIHGPEQSFFPFNSQSPDWHWYSDSILHFGTVKCKRINCAGLGMSTGISFSGIPCISIIEMPQGTSGVSKDVPASTRIWRFCLLIWSLNCIKYKKKHQKTWFFDDLFFNFDGFSKFIQFLLYHSMAKDNFNKSKETTPTTSAALKVAP